MNLACVPFAPGERFDMMWGCCGGTHRGSWQNNGNDYYAPVGTLCVAPIAGRVVRAGAPPIGQGARIGIEGPAGSVYMAHMFRLRVSVGTPVLPGDPVGEVYPFPGIPPHLHFSAANGSYGTGRFSDPWDQVQRMAKHINGRTYEAVRGIAGQKPVVTDPTPFYVEELPMYMSGEGPNPFGPWPDKPGYRAKREATIEEMRNNGRDARPYLDRGGSIWILEFPLGYAADPEPFRFGGWDSAEKAKRALKILTDDGRISRGRRFNGRANSYYPWV